MLVLLSFIGSQVVVQALGFSAGLLAVNMLPVEEYAYYTVAVAVAAGASVVTNSGFWSAILSEGARRRGDAAAFDGLVASIILFRSRSAVIGCLVVGPVCSWLLHSSGAPVGTCVAVSILTMMATFQSCWTNLYTEVLTLEYERTQQQLIPIKAALFRVVTLLAAVWIWPTSTAAVAVNNASLGLTGRLARQVAGTYILGRSRPDPEASRVIRTSFWQLLPSNIFTVVQGYFFLALLAVTGRTSVLAQIGALSRYSLLFGVVATAMMALTVPVLARAAPDQAQRLHLQILTLGSLLVGGLLLIAWILADPLAAGLGRPYDSLAPELRIVLIGGAVGAASALLSGLNQARGWIRHQWLQVPISLFWTTGLLLLVSPSSIRTAAIFSALAPVASVISQLVPLAVGLRGLRAKTPTPR